MSLIAMWRRSKAIRSSGIDVPASTCAQPRLARLRTFQENQQRNLVPPLGEPLNSQFNSEELFQTLIDFEDQLAPYKAELEELGL